MRNFVLPIRQTGHLQHGLCAERERHRTPRVLRAFLGTFYQIAPEFRVVFTMRDGKALIRLGIVGVVRREKNFLVVAINGERAIPATNGRRALAGAAVRQRGVEIVGLRSKNRDGDLSG